MPLAASDFEITGLAFDAQKSRDGDGGWLSLDDLGNLFQATGWTISDGRSPGTAARDLLAVAIADARTNPHSAHSFAPLFIRAMRADLQPEIDVTSGNADPSSVHLTGLEAELFLLQSIRPAVDVLDPALGQTEATFAGESSSGTESGQEAGTVCGKLKGSLIGPATAALLDKVSSQWVTDKLWEKVGIGGESEIDKAKAAVVTNVGNLMFILLAMHNISFQLSATIPTNFVPGQGFTASATEAHYSHAADINPAVQNGNRDQSLAQHVLFTANASFDNSLYAAAPQIWECAKLLGLPGPDDMKELVRKGVIYWDVDRLDPHARPASFVYPPNLNHEPKFFDGNWWGYIAGDAQKSTFWADMQWETENAHQYGQLQQGRIVMRAKLDTSSVPETALLWQTGITNIWDAIKKTEAAFGEVDDVLAGLFLEYLKRILSPTATLPIKVTWHVESNQCQGPEGPLNPPANSSPSSPTTPAAPAPAALAQPQTCKAVGQIKSHKRQVFDGPLTEIDDSTITITSVRNTSDIGVPMPYGGGHAKELYDLNATFAYSNSLGDKTSSTNGSGLVSIFVTEGGRYLITFLDESKTGFGGPEGNLAGVATRGAPFAYTGQNRSKEICPANSICSIDKEVSTDWDIDLSGFGLPDWRN
jgi:hypothetical protein